jgi:hypothetical protein
MKEFEVVKYFKSIYTPISSYGEALFCSNGKFFYERNPHFLMCGEFIKDDENNFIKWAADKDFILEFSKIDDLRECLKKNVISMSSDSNFEIKYKEKDSDTEKSFELSNSKMSVEMRTNITKIEEIDKKMKHSSKFSYSSFKEREIIELYLTQDNTVTFDRTDMKLIEVPFKRVISILKESEITIEFSELESDGKRYVKVSSSNGLIKLSQIYATI